MCSSDLDTGLDATQLFPKTLAARQEHDVALAALLLNEEILNEQQLAQALADWTIHGAQRSEERRVGKECRSRWSADH